MTRQILDLMRPESVLTSLGWRPSRNRLPHISTSPFQHLIWAVDLALNASESRAPRIQRTMPRPGDPITTDPELVHRATYDRIVAKL